MKWWLVILLNIFVVQAFAMTPEERAIRRAELRQQMRERMLNGFGDDPERTMREMERMMDDLVRDSMREIQNLQMQGFSSGDPLSMGVRGGVMTEWTEDKDGRILTVSPDKPETKMDVQVLNGIVTIKSEVTTPNSKNQFTRTQLVPGDCNGDRVRMDTKDGKLILHFPWKSSVKPTEKDRKPLKPGDAKIDI